jgi:amidase
MRHLFGTCDEVEFDFGQGDRCFDVVRAQSYADRYREAYAKDPNSLGPNVRANYEMSVNMTLVDMAWAHAEQTRIFRRFQAKFHQHDLVLSPTTPVSPFLGRGSISRGSKERGCATTCGVDEHTMRFGLQATGRFRGDRDLGRGRGDGTGLCQHPRARRPRSDLGKLAKPTVDLKSIATQPPLH